MTKRDDTEYPIYSPAQAIGMVLAEAAMMGWLQLEEGAALSDLFDELEMALKKKGFIFRTPLEIREALNKYKEANVPYAIEIRQALANLPTDTNELTEKGE